MMRSESQKYAPWLGLLLGLFCLRVAGQMMVVFGAGSYLPPMEEWQSGLLPYPVLLVSQVIIIAILLKVIRDFTRGDGYFVIPSARWGTGLLYFGWIYFGGMILRYAIRMTLYPDERWFGGTIPILFHCVLASFILLVSHYHRRAAGEFRREK